jgi:hypothetical protein
MGHRVRGKDYSIDCHFFVYGGGEGLVTYSRLSKSIHTHIQVDGFLKIGFNVVGRNRSQGSAQTDPSDQNPVGVVSLRILFDWSVEKSILIGNDTSVTIVKSLMSFAVALRSAIIWVDVWYKRKISIYISIYVIIATDGCSKRHHNQLSLLVIDHHS